MSWKLEIKSEEPVMKIVWDGLHYRTKVLLNNKDVTKLEEIPVNISTKPKIEVSLVSENKGEPRYGWSALTVRSDSGIEVPLFIKQAPLGTGEILVIDFKTTIDENFDKFMSNFVKYSSWIEVIGYTGIGNIQRALWNMIPYGVVVRLSERRAIVVFNVDSLIKTIEEELSSPEYGEYGAMLIERKPKIGVITIEPIDLPEFNLHIRMGDAGLNIYDMMTVDFDIYHNTQIAKMVTTNWSGIFEKIATDSTLLRRVET